MSGKLLAIGVLVVPALLLAPLEQRIHGERARLKYGGAHASLEMRDRLGQGLAIALLAGFRGVVADFVWIQNHHYWEQKEWLRMVRNMELATTLQPQSIQFWDTGAWHMAWNIGYAVRSDPGNRTQAIGITRERQWHERAREFLQRGIENVPQRYNLYFALGWLYQQKFKDECRAAFWYGQAAGYPDAPTYVARLHARAVEKCGDPLAAYELWKAMSRGDPNTPHQMWNVIERELRRLEGELNIPDAQRLFPKSAEPAAKTAG
jgi:hypothetical protein